MKQVEMLDEKCVTKSRMDELERQNDQLQTDTDLLKEDSERLRRALKINRIIDIVYAVLALVLVIVFWMVR